MKPQTPKTTSDMERLVDRAIHLWIEMLARPKYDNLGPDSNESPLSKTQNLFASMVTAAQPKNNTPEVLERFGLELKKRIMDESVYWFQRCHMHVDYHPDKILADAAEAAGLKMEFPWKTTVEISPEKNCVSVAFGYGAPYVHHYPLSHGLWLKTTLTGTDIHKIIKLVESGDLTLDLELSWLSQRPDA